MTDRYTTQRTPYARPAGVVHPVETYDGAELVASCPRAGAYDAMRLPSRLNGRMTTPPPIVTASSARRAVTARARISVSEVAEPTEHAEATVEVFHTPPELAPIEGADSYRPRPGSLAESVIQDLRTMPAGVAYTCDEIEAIFSAPRVSVATCLARCLEVGLLTRVKKGRCLAYTLPAAPAVPSPVSPTERSHRAH